MGKLSVKLRCAEEPDRNFVEELDFVVFYTFHKHTLPSCSAVYLKTFVTRLMIVFSLKSGDERLVSVSSL